MVTAVSVDECKIEMALHSLSVEQLGHALFTRMFPDDSG